MPPSANWIVLLAFVFIVFTFQSAAQIASRDMAKEEVIYNELRKTAPNAVDAFKAATAAMDGGKFDESEKLFTEVIRQSPKFDPAIRRLGFALVDLGRRDEGISKIQQAIDLKRSPENLISMAAVLIEPEPSQRNPSDADISKAYTLAKEADQLFGGNDPQALTIVADLALNAGNMADFRRSAEQLKAKFPNFPQTHFIYAIRLADDGEFDRAVAEVKIAESMGMPAEDTSQLIAGIEKAKDEASYGLLGYVKYLFVLIALVVLWAFGLLALFIAGKVLSAKTLQSIEDSDPNDVSGGGHAKLRRTYRKVITIAGLYYYISQPVVVLIVIASTLGVIAACFIIGIIPIKLLVILVFIGFGSIFYMFKSLIMRPKLEEPGRVLTEAEAPRLWNLVRTVASEINTRPADEIRITTGCELAVYERGGLRKKLNDNAERVLVVGVASLNDFSQNAFRAVLAHEYGHFSNRDTAGGDVAYRVNTDIFRLADAIGQSGTATFYNLTFQFIRLYHYLFTRIAHGASRLQEVLADRVAVYVFGAAAFREGLEHIVRREIEFERIANIEIGAALTANRSFSNFYELKETDGDMLCEIDQEFEVQINRPSTELDSHPSPVERFRLSDLITSKVNTNLVGMVWDLFEDKDAITKSMVEVIEERVRPGRSARLRDILS